MRTDPHQMAIMDALAERIRTIRSEGMATLALHHDDQVRMMPPRCNGCRASMTEEEIDYNLRNAAPGQGRCFVCWDESAVLDAHEVKYEPLPAAAVELF